MADIHEHDLVIDLRRARPGEPPVPGAQWDELRGRWERWDESADAWVIVGGDEDGHRVLPPAANVVPPYNAKELQHLEELEAEEVHVIDVDRLAAPPRPVPGAQWNEVLGRWERWSEMAGAWVEARAAARADSSAP